MISVSPLKQATKKGNVFQHKTHKPWVVHSSSVPARGTTPLSTLIPGKIPLSWRIFTKEVPDKERENHCALLDCFFLSTSTEFTEVKFNVQLAFNIHSPQSKQT